MLEQDAIELLGKGAHLVCMATDPSDLNAPSDWFIDVHGEKTEIRREDGARLFKKCETVISAWPCCIFRLKK